MSPLTDASHDLRPLAAEKAPETCPACGETPQNRWPDGTAIYRCGSFYEAGTRTNMPGWNDRCRAGWEWAAAHRDHYAALVAALHSLMVAYGALDGRNGNSGECWDKARAALAAEKDTP